MYFYHVHQGAYIKMLIIIIIILIIYNNNNNKGEDASNRHVD